MVIEVNQFKIRREEERVEQDEKKELERVRSLCKSTFLEVFGKLEDKYDIWFGGNCYEAYLKNRRDGTRINFHFPSSARCEGISLSVSMPEAYRDARRLAERLEGVLRREVELKIDYDVPNTSTEVPSQSKSKLITFLERLVR